MISEKAITIAVVWVAIEFHGLGNPTNTRCSVSAIAVSPIQPRPSEASVIPSWAPETERSMFSCASYPGPLGSLWKAAGDRRRGRRDSPAALGYRDRTQAAFTSSRSPSISELSSSASSASFGASVPPCRVGGKQYRCPIFCCSLRSG